MLTHWWTDLWKTLADERGQIPSTVQDDSAATEPAEVEPATTEPAPSQIGDQGATPAPEDTFFDPKQLPPELQGHWKKMQGAYTKRMQSLASVRDAAETVQRFNTDPTFRRQIFQQYAHEFGLSGQPAQPGAGTPTEAPPAEFVQAFKNALPPELQFMAESQAKAFWAANRLAMAPYERELQSTRLEDRSQQWDELASQLPPGWEEHEDEMADLLDFLESPSFRHPVYGSKLDLLYRLATGQAMSTIQAIERIGAAGQNRTISGGVGRRVEDNLSQRIMNPKVKLRDAIQMAGRAAMEQLEAKGARFEAE